ncbi:hypothetical protein PFICI_11291 [Pestalotiopsis fici W106-1]|uniref:Major facilitator superfamily (MFS) profile domain-containing protein n=1 Tax=Pestalotiopsis fici (strain W106-1 / CGMCC3.15140) TaxID=1229662 RepID=W3WWC3_PESFW|nr:uncharacterized protein PFICI_11291 [Pestalotiopsis fici W106-1]ETS77417.1 hypothetical protein PFICI_11291 [Pestalotiopsis fici W106-1]
MEKTASIPQQSAVVSTTPPTDESADDSIEFTIRAPFDDFPDGGRDAWLCVFGGFLAMFCCFGLLNCAGVFLEYYVQGPLAAAGPSNASWITSIQIAIQTGSAILWGRLFDAYGPRRLIFIGSIVYCFGLMMLSLSTHYYQFFLSQSIVAAAASGAIFNASMSSVATWFFKRRAAAFGIMNAGSSLGGVCLPIMMNHLFRQIGFPWTIRVLGFLFLAMCGVASMTIKSRLPPRRTPFLLNDYIRPFQDLPMVLTMLGGFFFFWGMFLPLSYIILQGQSAGMSTTLAEYLLPILNAVSIVGRVVSGFAADRIGRYNAIILVAFLSGAFTIALWIPAKTSATIIAYGVLFGFASGGFIPLVPSCIAQISDIKEIGTRTGTASFLQAFGALSGSPIGGALIDQMHGSYLGLQLFCGLSMLVSVLFYGAARYVQAGFRVERV